jgi:hypothetical protein
MIDPVRFSGALKVDIFLLTPTNNKIYEVKLHKFIQLFLLKTLPVSYPVPAWLAEFQPGTFNF